MKFDYSILIPTWNNLELLQLLVRSIREHSRGRFQLLIYVNEGSDGTEKWLQSQDIEYIQSAENLGICVAMNQLRKLVKSDLICYLNDDMYVLPDWDEEVLKVIRTLKEPYFISSTMLEPGHNGSPTSIKADFGDQKANFKEDALLRSYMDIAFQDWSGSTWPPLWLSTSLWDEIGGFSEEFSPGMYSDPDMAMKAWAEGVRYFRGISESRVYHFGSKSTVRLSQAAISGRAIFLRKWGITARYFYKYYLKMGKPFTGSLHEPKHPFLGLLINRWKKYRASSDKLTLY